MTAGVTVRSISARPYTAAAAAATAVQSINKSSTFTHTHTHTHTARTTAISVTQPSTQQAHDDCFA